MEAFGSSWTGIPLNTGYCQWRVDVYPSAQMQVSFYNNTPMYYVLGVVAIFIFAGSLVMLYDFLVERRQRHLTDTATKSNAIVSSLFPEVVRDRLFDNGGAASGVKKYMAESALDNNALFDAPTSAPIADLFPNCTVMFGDIAGFTAWSSAREPSQVFTLLETVYGVFDKLAKKQGVFKVETIGDCYLAVTGLPDPQVDHAVRMARFAGACIKCVKDVTKQLEVTLGPDTADISFRIGLHSGPVTAGVLRGEKSRFQLFGDTVNTAARMESLGKPGMIQVSHATAALIEQGGKGHWLAQRGDAVKAKGKGELETYWVNPNARPNLTVKECSGKSHFQPEVPNPQVEEQHIRLINWNVDLLTRLLKNILVHRKQTEMGSYSRLVQEEEFIEFSGINEQHLSNKSPRQEVAEIISLPKKKMYTQRSEDIDPQQLSSEVTEQLTDLVKSISSLYQQNHFHSFEHACNVTMSTRKFLSRVVSPSMDGTDVNELHSYTYGITSDPLTQFAIVFSALIHDLDHQGISNFQLIKEGSRIASLYNNKSVAEQNSVDLAWHVLASPEYKDLMTTICATESDYARFRQLVVNSVLATDIFDKELVEFRNNRWKKAFHPDVSASTHSEAADLKATIVIEHIIQASDVGHTMQHWHMYQKWNQRLFFEMYEAYLNGRGDNDPSEGWYKGELWFFDNYVIPLGMKLKECKVFGVASDECLNYALQNRKEWQSKGEAIVQELVAKYKAQHVEGKSKSGSAGNDELV